MGEHTFSRDAYSSVRDHATGGGTKSATSDAEERYRKKKEIDPLVDPKGPAHLGPIRRSLPRFNKKGELWVLTCGLPMAEETLLDTTGSMGDNVERAFEALPHSYQMYTTGSRPVMGRYDPQIATAIFNDVEDVGIPVLCRSQFEMDEKVALQMTHMLPGGQGQGNEKEDSQYGLFGAAYLTDARIVQYGLKYYHFTVSDEPVAERVLLSWLKTIFGDDVLEHVKANGYGFDTKHLPDIAKIGVDLQKKAHAFFLQVNDRVDVRDQWKNLYGADHFIQLPDGTSDLHCFKATIIGLTEGELDLKTAKDFLREHKISAEEANRIIRAVAHIPLGVQRLNPNFDKLPKAGDLFKEKTDLWPVDPSEVGKVSEKKGAKGKDKGPEWL
jgi:hypothetical protein